MARTSAAAKLGLVHGLQGPRAAFVLALFETETPAAAAARAGVTKNPGKRASVWMRQQAVIRAIVLESKRRQQGNEPEIERLRDFLKAVTYCDVTEIIGWDAQIPDLPEGAEVEDLLPKYAGHRAFIHAGDTGAVLWIRRMSELTAAQRQAVKSIKQKINGFGRWLEVEFYDKLQAANLLARTYGMFKAQESDDLATIAEEIRRRSAYAQAERDRKLPPSKGRVFDNDTGTQL